MFNTETTINVSVRHDGRKTQVSVRWPTDDEWITYRRKKPLNVRFLGRGQTEQAPEAIEPDHQLYQTIQQNGAPALTPAEAKAVIDGISRCDVLNVDLGTDDATVEMDTIHGQVKHILKVPTMDQIREFQLTSHVTSQPSNRSMQIRNSVESAGRLWDKCAPKTEGYESAVPLLHKDIAIRNLIQAVEQEMVQGSEEQGF